MVVSSPENNSQEEINYCSKVDIHKITGVLGSTPTGALEWSKAAVSTCEGSSNKECSESSHIRAVQGEGNANMLKADWGQCDYRFVFPLLYLFLLFSAHCSPILCQYE